MEKQLDRKTAAKEFAEQIRKLAENGHIDAMSLKLYNCGYDNLLKLNEIIGIRDLNISAIFGVSRKS